MSDKPTSPFARLDTSLLRSTKPTAVADPAPPPAESTPPAPSPATARPQRERRREPKPAAVASSVSATMVEPTAPRHPDTTTPPLGPELIQAVRKAVKAIGKEGATLRLTVAEKQQLKDMVYTYTRRGQRTSETELIRIATNYMLEDYRRNGEHSLVAQVLAALDS